MNVKEFFELSLNYHNKLIDIMEIELNNPKVSFNSFNYFERTYFNCGTNIGMIDGLNQLFKDENKATEYFENKRKNKNIPNLNNIFVQEELIKKAFLFFENNLKSNIENKNFLPLKNLYLQFIKRFKFIDKNLSKILDEDKILNLSLDFVKLFSSSDDKKRIISSYLMLKYDDDYGKFSFDKDTFGNFSLLYKIPQRFKNINFNICFSNYFFLGYSEFKIFPKYFMIYSFLNYFKFFISELLLFKNMKENINFFDPTNYYKLYFDNKIIPKRIEEAIKQDIKNIGIKLLIFNKLNINMIELFENALEIAKDLKQKNLEEIQKINYLLFKEFHD